jgi:serine protease Do
MFDEQVVRLDPTIKPLLDQFVCVRIIQGNGLDLSIFQFDYDLTFSAFFLNADGTVYGRFGTRSDHEEAARDISLAGFKAALERTLEWHRKYPANKSQFAGKKGPAPTVARPEEYPAYQGKFTSSTDPKRPVQSCIHCHMIGEGERAVYFDRNATLPEQLLSPYPLPQVIGLEMDPNKCSTVARVLPGSLAEVSGFRPGDAMTRLNGQPLLSTADIQWILHQAKDGDTLRAEVQRGTEGKELRLVLSPGWRKTSDIAWRVSTWELRRKVLGGMVLKSRNAGGKEELYVNYLGQYGEHATAQKQGFKKEDVLLKIGEMKAPEKESTAIEQILTGYKKGEIVPVLIRRDSGEKTLQLPVQ